MGFDTTSGNNVNPTFTYSTAGCTACAAGVWCPAGQSGPSSTPCLAGYYCPGGASPAPVKCPAGTYSLGGSTAVSAASCQCLPNFAALGYGADGGCVYSGPAPSCVANTIPPSFSTATMTWAPCQCSWGAAPAYASVNGTQMLAACNIVAQPSCIANAGSSWDPAGYAYRPCACNWGFAPTFNGTALAACTSVPPPSCPANADAQWDSARYSWSCACGFGYAPVANATTQALAGCSFVAPPMCPPNAFAGWNVYGATSSYDCLCSNGFAGVLVGPMQMLTCVQLPASGPYWRTTTLFADAACSTPTMRMAQLQAGAAPVTPTGCAPAGPGAWATVALSASAPSQGSIAFSSGALIANYSGGVCALQAAVGLSAFPAGACVQNGTGSFVVSSCAGALFTFANYPSANCSGAAVVT